MLVAVLPFRVGGTLDPAGGFVAGHALGAVPDDLGVSIAARLSRRLAALGVAVADPDTAAGATALADAGTYDVRLATRVASRVGATVVVLGAVSRYEQREGNAWAVRTPATVEYQAVLVRVADGAVVLVDGFAYTQKALSENLLELPQFLRAGGRWLEREEILDGALQETARRLGTALHGAAAARGAG